MAEKKGGKRGDRVLAIAIGVAVLTVAVYVGYLKIPRHVSRLCPEVRQAELIYVLYIDEDLKSTSANFEGEDLEALIQHLDSFEFYRYPEGEQFGDSFVLEGETHWQMICVIDGRSSTIVNMSEKGQIAIGGRVYRTTAEDFAPLPISLLGQLS